MIASSHRTSATEYLEAVTHELRDLPSEDRAALHEDLRLHLQALADEGTMDFETRLGPPGSYAAELRASAGLPAQPSRSRASLAFRTLPRAWTGSLRNFLPELTPAWWLARGYLLVLLPCLATSNDSLDFPLPAPGGSHLLGAALVLIAMRVSVAVGRRVRRKVLMAAVVVLDIGLVAAAGLTAGDAPSRFRTVKIVQAAPASPFTDSPLVTPHGPITNILPFTPGGKPLKDVVLYDQDGLPVVTGAQLWWADNCRRLPQERRARDGGLVVNVYPKTYVLDPARRTQSGFAAVRTGQCRTLAGPAIDPPLLPVSGPVSGGSQDR